MSKIIIKFTNEEWEKKSLDENVQNLICNDLIFDYDKNTTVHDLFLHFYNIIGQSYISEFYAGTDHFYLRIRKQYMPLRCDYSLSKLLDNFHICRVMYFEYREMYGEGGVEKSAGERIGVKFFFHSEERCHYCSPHVHVQDIKRKDDIVSIYFSKEITVEGKMSIRKLNKAIKYIEENRKKFIRYWNEYTNGIKIPEI